MSLGLSFFRQGRGTCQGHCQEVMPPPAWHLATCRAWRPSQPHPGPFLFPVHSADPSLQVPAWSSSHQPSQELLRTPTFLSCLLPGPMGGSPVL